MANFRVGGLRATRQLGVRLGLIVATIAMMAICGGITAVSAQTYTLPPFQTSDDANGVDLISGLYNGATTDASIGSASAGGLPHSYIGRYFTAADNYSSALILNLPSVIGNVATVFLGRAGEQFTLTTTGWAANSGTGSTLTVSGYSGSYTTRDGTQYIYSLHGTNSYCNNIYNVPPGDINGFGSFVGELDKIVRSSGEVLNITWFQRGSQGSVTCVSPLSVSSNRGVAIDYSYVNTTFQGWSYLYSVTGINSAYYYCDPTQFETGGSGCFSLSPSSSSWSTYVPATSTGEPASTPQSVAQVIVSDAIRRGTHDWYSGLVTYPSGLSVTYSQNSSGQVTSVTNGTGTWGYSYVTSGTTETTTVTDPLSHQRIVTSDLTLQRVTSDQDALGNKTSYSYDSLARLQQATDPEGNYTHYTYDARGNVTQTLQAAKPGSGLANVITSAAFDPTCGSPVKCNEPNSTTDANGKSSYYTYSTVHGGFLTKILPPAPNGISPTFAYSYAQIQAYVMNSTNTARVPAGLLWEPTGTTTCATSAAMIAATMTSASLTCAAGASDLITTTISYAGSYNALPTSVTTTGANGFSSTTTAAYDNVGNVLSIQGPLGANQTTRYRYDAARQKVGVVGPDPDGSGPLKNRAVRFTYSPDGLPTLVERGTVPSQSDSDWPSFATLAQEAIAYDALDRAATKSYATAPGGAPTIWSLKQFSYDNANRLTCSAVRMNQAAFSSLPASACTLGTQGADGPDRITSYGYDNDNRLQQVTQAVGVTGTTVNERTLTYTPNGLVRTVADAKGNLTTNVYDGFDRLWKIQYPTPSNGSVSSTTDFEQYTYDSDGHIINDKRRDGQVSVLGYDDLGRLGSLSLPVSSSYAYDNLGRLVTATRGDQTLSYTYDPFNDRTSESGAYGVFNYQYDASGDLIRIIWPDGLYATYVPDWTGEITAIEENGATSGVGLLATYGYNDLGQRTSVTRGDGVTTAYNYDGAWRLMGLAHSFPSSANNQTWGLGYNTAGQINSRSSANSAYDWTAAAAPVTYLLNGQNQVTQAGSTPFTYGDSRGNLTSDGVNTYGYDSANNLTSFNTNTTLRSDPAGRLMSVTDTSGGVTTTASRWFRYGGAGLLAEYGMTPSDNGTLYARYVPGPGPDETVVWYNSSDTSQRRWLIPDERGSVAAVADVGGNLLTTNLYDEYGIPGGSNLGRMQYTGQMWIPEASLYHFKARDYVPILGRFLQTDPASYGDGLDWYLYAHGDPLNQIDPSGLDGTATTVGEEVVTGHYTPPPSFNLWAIVSGIVNKGIQTVNYGSQFFLNNLSRFANFGPTQGTCAAFPHEAGQCASGNFLGSRTSQFQILKYGLGAPALGVGGGFFIAPGGTLLAAEGVEGASSFFEGTQYTSKVLQQMEGGVGEFHSFPESVTAFEDSGSVSTITGGDGAQYQMLRIPGSYQSTGGTWYDGEFQFIKDGDGLINHRLFVPTTPVGP